MSNQFSLYVLNKAYVYACSLDIVCMITLFVDPMLWCMYASIKVDWFRSQVIQVRILQFPTEGFKVYFH